MDGRDSTSPQPTIVIVVPPSTKHDWQTLKSKLETILNEGASMSQKISVEFLPGAKGVDPMDKFSRYSLVIVSQKGGKEKGEEYLVQHTTR